MRTRIRFTPDPTGVYGFLTGVPAFPGEAFRLTLPEAIGDASRAIWTGDLAQTWTEHGIGRWKTQAHSDGELEFVLTLTPGYDTVDIDVSVTNKSARLWTHSMAFCCLNCAASPSLADFECARHWVRAGARFRRLVEMPRKYSGRPTIQVYSIQGAPPAMEIPFAAQFDATPDVVPEGWLAIQSRDGNRLAAVVSNPALFLFQNMEYSCVHCAPSFGALGPGQVGSASTRMYFVQASIHDWYRRMKMEMGA
jgi:hypothetical protein